MKFDTTTTNYTTTKNIMFKGKKLEQKFKNKSQYYINYTLSNHILKASIEDEDSFFDFIAKLMTDIHKLIIKSVQLRQLCV